MGGPRRRSANGRARLVQLIVLLGALLLAAVFVYGWVAEASGGDSCQCEESFESVR